MELKEDSAVVMNVQPEDNIWRLHNQQQPGRQPGSGWFNTENVSQWAAAVQPWETQEQTKIGKLASIKKMCWASLMVQW